MLKPDNTWVIATSLKNVFASNQMNRNFCMIAYRTLLVALIAYCINFWYEDKENKVYKQQYISTIEAEMACDDWSNSPFYEFKRNSRWNYQGNRGGL